MSMEELDDIRASKKIVQMYRFDVDERIKEESPAYPLSQALVAERGRIQNVDPWRRFFEPENHDNPTIDPIANTLHIETSKLKENWLIFHQGCSRDDCLDLGSSEPTIEGVLEVVKRIENDWKRQRQDTRRGKAINMFHRLCRGIDSHKSLLEILPEGNEYVSIFTGTLNVILKLGKASANHERLIEGLSKALSTVTDHVAECQVELDIYETREMKEAIANMYAEIFLLLSDIMRYLTRKRIKRLLDSFNEDIYKRYEDEINNINSKAQRIQRLAQQGSRAEVRAIRVEVESLRRNLVVGQEGEARYRAELMAAANRMGARQTESLRKRDPSIQKQLMGQLACMLDDEALQSVINLRAATRSAQLREFVPLEWTTGPGNEPQSAPSIPKSDSYVVDDILLQSNHIEDFFDRERVRVTGMQLRPVTQTDQVIRRLSDWTKSDPSILWLEGPASTLRDEYNPLSTIAARVVDLADEANVNVISYFCHLPRGEHLRPGNGTQEAQASVALVTALTRQAMELLLPRFDTSIDMSEGRVRKIGGTMDTLPETLRLFGDVLKILDMQLLCVIDGLHWLDDRSTNSVLSELVRTLRDSDTKVLFTTTGRSACLQDELGRMEKLTIQSLDPKGSDVMLSGQTLELRDSSP